MHRDLFKAIVMTYYEPMAFDGKDYKSDGDVDYGEKLRANLIAFFMVYYPEGTYFPEEVREFLESRVTPANNAAKGAKYQYAT